MNRNAIRFIILAGIVVITGIIAVQAFWIKKAFDLKEKEFKTTVNQSLTFVADQISDVYGLTKIESPVTQIEDDYFVVNLRAPLEKDVLVHLLKEEFKKKNLDTDFEYGIYNCDTDEIVYGDYINTSFQVHNVEPNTLPKTDQYLNYFGVRFPNKTSFISSNLDFWLISSLVTLIVTAFFGYAMFVILKQKRLSDVQRDFMNNMTHEFQTPISTIKIASEVLMQDKVLENPNRLKKYASIINQENTRLKNQVESVLTTARLGKGHLELKLEEFDLHECITEVTEPIFEELGDKLVYELNAVNPIIKGDKVHVKNIIRNLIDNAVKYSKDQIKIYIITENHNKSINLKIKDKGIGIPKAAQKKIFEKFYRVPTGNVHNVKGFGLGLNYVKLVVDAHKWKISVDSEVNKGTEFIIGIPQT